MATLSRNKRMAKSRSSFVSMFARLGSNALRASFNAWFTTTGMRSATVKIPTAVAPQKLRGQQLRKRLIGAKTNVSNAETGEEFAY